MIFLFLSVGIRWIHDGCTFVAPKRYSLVPALSTTCHVQYFNCIQILSSAANRISAFRQFCIIKVHNLCILRAILSLWVLPRTLHCPLPPNPLVPHGRLSSYCFPLAFLFAFIIAFSMNNHGRKESSSRPGTKWGIRKIRYIEILHWFCYNWIYFISYKCGR